MTRSSGLPGAVLLAAAALLAWGSAALLLRQEFRQVTGEATKSIATMMVQDEHRLRQRTLQAENQVLFFAATPPVAGIGRALLNNGLDPADGTPLAQWRARLEQIARAYVAAHAEVLSMCLIGVADGGREVVRVHRNTAGTVTVVAPGELQQKGDRPYFTAAVRLPEGAVYLSPVELNQEHGRIELPARPTLRAAMPVRNARGEVFGVVVLNTAAQPLLDAIATPDLPDVTEWVTDAAGQYLWHPQPGKALAHELAPPGTTWQQEFPAAPEAQTVAPIGGLPAGTAHATRRASDGADWQMLTRTLRAPDASGAGGLVLHSGIPVAVLQARAWDSVRGQLLQVWAMGLFVIGLLVFMLLRWRGTPLGLTLEAEAGAPGRTLRLFGVELPLTATGHRPRWQVVTAALLPVLWWGVLQLVVGNQEMKHPFIVMLLPVLVASWWGGLFAGLAASLLAVVGAWNLVTDSPLMNWGSYGELIGDVGAVVGAATLLLTGMLVTFTQEAVRRRAAQLVVSERAARERERRDVTQAVAARQAAEEAVTMAQLELAKRAVSEQTLREHGDQLRRAVMVAEHTARTKAEFLANVSHELRTPLTGIIGYADSLLEEGPFGPLTAWQRNAVQQIGNSGNYLMSLLTNILDLSKIESGELVLEEIEVVPAAIVAEVHGAFDEAARAKGLALRSCVDAGLPDGLLGDPTRLRQVLTNYVSNALKFTAQGAIDTLVEVVEQHAATVLLRFCVRDTGVGISEAAIGRVFQAFRQADVSTTRQYGGVGLGLAIAKDLATRMGGEVGVDSRLGHGSTFWFTARLRRRAPQ